MIGISSEELDTDHVGCFIESQLAQQAVVMNCSKAKKEKVKKKKRKFRNFRANTANAFDEQ